MRGRNLNPERREQDAGQVTGLFDESVIAALSQRSARSRNAQQRRERRRRAQVESHIPQREPQRLHRNPRIVTLQSSSRIHPQREPNNYLPSSTVPLGQNDPETLRLPEVVTRDPFNGFLGPSLSTPSSGDYQQQFARSSLDIPSNPYTDPIYLGQYQPTASSTPSQPSAFSVTGPAGRISCDVDINYQLESSFISSELANGIGCPFQIGNPTWNNQAIFTSEGLVQLELWVEGVTIESHSPHLRIPATTTNFKVSSHGWNGAPIVLGKPILDHIRLLNFAMQYHIR